MTRFLPLLFLPFLAGASPIAEVICGSGEEIRNRITHEFGEELFARGLRDPDSMMEVWSSDSGSWTMTISYADGRRCIVAMGEHWDRPLPPQSGLKINGLLGGQSRSPAPSPVLKLRARANPRPATTATPIPIWIQAGPAEAEAAIPAAASDVSGAESHFITAGYTGPTARLWHWR